MCDVKMEDAIETIDRMKTEVLERGNEKALINTIDSLVKNAKFFIDQPVECEIEDQKWHDAIVKKITWNWGDLTQPYYYVEFEEQEYGAGFLPEKRIKLKIESLFSCRECNAKADAYNNFKFTHAENCSRYYKGNAMYLTKRTKNFELIHNKTETFIKSESGLVNMDVYLTNKQLYELYNLLDDLIGVLNAKKQFDCDSETLEKE